MRGAPDPAGSQMRSANLSPPLPAKVRQIDSCSAPRMLTQNDPLSRNFGHDVDFLSGMNATSGGSSDTDENEPTARPAGLPSLVIPVTTATPVGKCPSTVRKCEPSIGLTMPPPFGEART